MQNKILVICGSTATGKTDLAIKLAKKFNGELINADSRQVYKGMDIGTGKDIPVSSKFKVQSSKLQCKIKNLQIGYRKKEGIPVWLVDVCQPDYVFNVGEYQKLARLVIADIQKRGKLPVVVGGTGLYIKSILEPLTKMQIPPNIKLRKKLAMLSIAKLQNQLVKLDKLKFSSMNHSDQNNPRRLVRAIEIEEYKNSGLNYSSRDDERQQGRIEKFSNESSRLRSNNINNQSPLPTGDSLVIGLKVSPTELGKRIAKRVQKRLKQGILTEIQNLLDSGFSWNLPAMSGLGYREWKEYFENSELNDQNSRQNNLNAELNDQNLIIRKEKIVKLWKLHEKQYAKKQMTWFKKMPGVNWFDIGRKNFQKQILSLVGEWYNKN